jgi:predicted nucleotide-binding protein
MVINKINQIVYLRETILLMGSEQKRLTDILITFKGLLVKYYNNPTNKLRTEISKNKKVVEDIVNKANTGKKVTISPPPMVGGYQFSNANPFNLIFDAPYGMNITQVILDIIDETIGVVENDENFTLTKKETSAGKPKGKSIDPKKIFLVHGHDNELKEKSARFLEKLGLHPIILHEQSNKGKTIIEKFEENADVAYAIVLMSPDDIGRSMKENPDSHNFRARQNVVFELGYFIGRLGRDKVCGILKGAIEKPSDYDGILYIQYDEADGWKLLLARELKNANIPIDLNNAV